MEAEYDNDFEDVMESVNSPKQIEKTGGATPLGPKIPVRKPIGAASSKHSPRDLEKPRSFSSKNRSSMGSIPHTSYEKKKKRLSNVASTTRTTYAHLKPFTTTSRSQQQYKKGLSLIEHELRSLQGKHEELLDEYKPEFDTLPEERQFLKLKRENKMIREELKRINILISQLVENRRTAMRSSVPKIQEINPQVELKELQNAEKQLENAEVEFSHLKTQIEKVSGTEYLEGLRQRNMMLDLKIKRMQKNKKSMEVEQAHREKRLESIIDDRDSKVISQIQADCTITKKKIYEIDSILERRATSMQSQNHKMGDVREQWLRIDDEAKVLGVSLISDLENKKTEHKFERAYIETLNKKENLEKEITLFQRKCY